MFRLVLMTRKRLIKLIKDAYERGKQEGLKRGYRLGEIAGVAAARNRGCILSAQPDRERVEELLKDMGFV